MVGIPQRLRTVVQQVEVFCHRTKQFHHDTHCCREKKSKNFVFLLNEGAQIHDLAISKLIPKMQFLTGFLNNSIVLLTVGSIPYFKQVHRHLHGTAKNEHKELSVHDFATGWQDVNQP